MKDWWAQRPERERRLLLGGAVCALLLLLYGAVWAPLIEQRDSWRQRAAAAEQALRWMRAAATQVAQQPRTALATDGRSLLARIDEGARQAGLGGVLLRVEPLASGRVRAHFQAAPFDVLMDWLQPLARQGVRLEELSVQRSSGVGLVDVRLTLYQTGAR